MYVSKDLGISLYYSRRERINRSGKNFRITIAYEIILK